MNTAGRFLLIALYFGVFGFCAFAFLATYEPQTGNMLPWRVLYGGAGCGALFGIARIVRKMVPSK